MEFGNINLDTKRDMLDPVYALFEETSKKAVPYMISSKRNEELSQSESDSVFQVWNLLVIVLDFLEGLFSDRTSASELGTSQALVQYAIQSKPLVKSLVDLLHVAQEHLPKANKLSEFMDAQSRQDSAESHADHFKAFPLIKGRIICLLGILSMGNKSVQDEIRERQGLELVLSNCVIDVHNPFIKERSIVCLRYLLNENPENQAFVAKLEAKSSVTEEALVGAGYETEIIDGKIALKKTPKIEELS